MIHYLNDKEIRNELRDKAVSTHLRELGGSEETKTVTTEWHEQRIEQELGKLPAQQRLAIYLKFWDCYSPFEIAYIIGVPVATVPKLIQAALTHLRVSLQDVGSDYFKTSFHFQEESAA